MKTIILTAALTLLGVSGAANYAFYKGKIGSAHYSYVKMYASQDDYETAAAVR